MPFPIDTSEMVKTEQRLGKALPPAYTAKMRLENGGEVVVDGEPGFLHPLLDESSTKRMTRTCNDVIRETGAAREWPDFPPEALAIADNGGGDRLVFLPNDERRYGDEVYRWDHETGEVEAVAKDFTSLGD